MAAFADETVLVTGAGRGLGRGIAAAFLAEGAHVALADIDEGLLDATVSQLGESDPERVMGIPADVSSAHDARRMVDLTLAWRGRINHLVNNAGVVRIAALVDVTDSDWDRVIAVNLTGVFLGMRAVLPHMLERGAGSIVNIASQAGKRGNRYIAPLIGNPLATTVCAARLIFGGTLDELGALRLVLTHGGGYLPYQIGRLDHGHRVRPEAKGCAHPPSAYLSRFWFDTVTHAPGPLRFLADTVGTDHLVYGTDFPFDMAAGPLADQLAGTGIAGADVTLMAGRNAAALFGLGPPGGLR